MILCEKVEEKNVIDNISLVLLMFSTLGHNKN